MKDWGIYKPYVKICGITTIEEINYMNNYHPDYVGFVYAKSKRNVTKKQSKELSEYLLPSIKTVGVFVNEDIEYILELVEEKIIQTIQLHGEESEEYIRKLREDAKAPIILAIKARDKNHMIERSKIDVDYLLFDTYDKEYSGGMGKTFPWSMIPKVDKPYFVAGGLSPLNIKDCIVEAKPYGIDLSSGLEHKGKKSESLIKELMENIENYKKDKVRKL